MKATLMPTVANARWEVDGWRLAELEQNTRDLARAKKLIRRLRAQNRALKAEHASIYGEMQARFSRLADYSHKYGAKVMMLIMRKRTF